MMAQKIGLPVAHFITGTNANNIVPHYLKTGDYTSKETIATIANAMDVAAPSNFIRIEELHDHDIEKLRKNLSGFSYDDDHTRATMKKLFSEFDYTADPHGAIGYSALKDFIKETGYSGIGVFLETAHPVKFLDVIPKTISDTIVLPKAIANIMHKQKNAKKISTYSELKSNLLSGF
jgi:threonine synthase